MRDLAKHTARLAGRFLGRQGERGSVAPMLAFMLVPLIGSMALAGELSSWLLTNRGLQNAADSAAIAAATNNNTSYESGSSTIYNYQAEAYAVTADYGFTNGSNNVTVTVTTTTASPCPSGDTCYQVTVTKKVPLYLVQIAGYTGNTTLSGANAESLSATAIADPSSGTGAQFCVLALGSSGVDLTSNGGPKANLSGCDVGSNSSMTCNGHDLGADAGYAVGTDNGCGAVTHSNQKKVTDPYAALAASIPSNTCSPSGTAGTYKQEASGTQTKITGAQSGGGTVIICGDLQLTGNASYPAGTTLVIENGELDTNGNAFTLNGGTVIFTGPTIAGLSPTHTPTGGGTVAITAPTSGTWSGMAMYQDPALTTGIDVSAAGNSPTWDIVGMNYFPNANFTISGAVGKDESGACQGFVVGSMTINGTGYIVDNNGCAAAGLTLPSYPASRVALVE